MADFVGILSKRRQLVIVEGLTEFLPVSSTGLLIVVGDLIHFNDEKGKVFEMALLANANDEIIL